MSVQLTHKKYFEYLSDDILKIIFESVKNYTFFSINTRCKNLQKYYNYKIKHSMIKLLNNDILINLNFITHLNLTNNNIVIGKSLCYLINLKY